MGQTIKTVLLNYAICAFIGGVLEYLSPQKAKTTVRVVVVSVLLLGIVSPIVKSEISVEDLFPDTETKENVNYNALMHTANITERKLRDEMKEILIKMNINEYEIYITTSVDEEENTVYLEEIKIEVDSDFGEMIPEIKKNVPKEYQEILKVGVKNE